MKTGHYTLFCIGTLLLALVIGGLIGVSSSPVVAVVLPLMFALLSAGGAAFVVLGKDDGAAVAAGKVSRRERAQFLGLQYIAFALGFIPGVYLGVGAKFHSVQIWGSPSAPQVAYTEIEIRDPKELAAAIALDERMISDRVPLAARQKVLIGLHAATAQRRDSKTSALSPEDSSGFDDIIKGLQKDTKGAGKKPGDIGPVALGPGVSTETTT